MTSFRTTAIAALAAISMAAVMASPAEALSKKQRIGLGVGLGAIALGAAAASANARHRDYYDDDYYDYRSSRAYRRAANRCADRFGWETRRWYRCMDRAGY
jgi:hypothetical protein